MSRQPSLQSQNFTMTSASGSCVFLPSPIQAGPIGMMDSNLASPPSGLPTPIMAPRRASSLAMAFGGGAVATAPAAAISVAPQSADHSTNTSTASASMVAVGVKGAAATTTTTTKRRYSHNPYATSSASSNASDSSAPSTPLMGSFAGVPLSYMPSNGVDAIGVVGTDGSSSMPQHHHRVGSTFSTGVHLAPSHLQQTHQSQAVDCFGYGPATQPLPAPISVPAGVVGGYGGVAGASGLTSPASVSACGVSIGVGHHHHQRSMLHSGVGAAGAGSTSGLAAALPPSVGSSSAPQSNLASPQMPMLQGGAAAQVGGNHHPHHHPQHHAHSHHHQAQGPHVGGHPSGPGSAAGSSAAAGAAMPIPTAMSIKAALEQFEPLRGQLPAAACSQRGRHAIVAVLRSMDPAATAACVAELKGAWGVLIQDPNGCHVARTLVECISDAQAAELAMSLTREEVHTMAAVSQHARRVLQALFERHRPAALQPIVEHIAAGAVGLAMTQQGCIGVMRVLEYADASQRALVLGALTPSLAQLAMDPFGNYVVQTIASSVERDVACAAIAQAFRGHWVRLACNKFASNVLEKVLRIATPLVRDALLEDICYSPAGLGIVIQDAFGNFVLQAVIESCQSGAELRRLGERIRPMLASSPYGHKIEGKLKSKRLPMDM